MNHCDRLRLDSMSPLPCGKRGECWSPSKCKHVPRGAKFVAFGSEGNSGFSTYVPYQLLRTVRHYKKRYSE